MSLFHSTWRVPLGTHCCSGVLPWQSASFCIFLQPDTPGKSLPQCLNCLLVLMRYIRIADFFFPLPVKTPPPPQCLLENGAVETIQVHVNLLITNLVEENPFVLHRNVQIYAWQYFLPGLGLFGETIKVVGMHLVLPAELSRVKTFSAFAESL